MKQVFYSGLFPLISCSIEIGKKSVMYTWGVVIIEVCMNLVCLHTFKAKAVSKTLPWIISNISASLLPTYPLHYVGESAKILAEWNSMSTISFVYLILKQTANMFVLRWRHHWHNIATTLP